MHAGAVSVKDAIDTDIDFVLAMIIHTQGLGYAFAFVVTTSRSDRVNISQVSFGLGVNFRITIDFRSGGLQKTGVMFLGQTKHVDHPFGIGFDGADRVVLVVDRGSGAGQVVYLVDWLVNI